jgi:hypothetical protein
LNSPIACTESAAPQPDDAHIEDFGELREAPPNLPQPDDEKHLAAELVLPTRKIADHAAPEALCLVVPRLGKPAAQREDESHRVLCDRAVVDAACAGEADAALLQFLERKLVGAGANRLDEAKLACAVEKAVVPQPGDYEHVGLAHAVLQRLVIANGEAADAGIKGRKPLMQLIGDMGETDRELVVGRKHRLPLTASWPVSVRIVRRRTLGALAPPLPLSLYMLLPGGGAISDEVAEFCRRSQHRRRLLIVALLIADRQSGDPRCLDPVDLRRR